MRSILFSASTEGAAPLPAEPFRDAALARAVFLRRVHHEEDGVAPRHRVERVADHRGVHPVLRPMNARSIDEHDLGPRASRDAENPLSGRLGFVRDDRDFRARRGG